MQQTVDHHAYKLQADTSAQSGQPSSASLPVIEPDIEKSKGKDKDHSPPSGIAQDHQKQEKHCQEKQIDISGYTMLLFPVLYQQVCRIHYHKTKKDHHRDQKAQCQIMASVLFLGGIQGKVHIASCPYGQCHDDIDHIAQLQQLLPFVGKKDHQEEGDHHLALCQGMLQVIQCIHILTAKADLCSDAYRLQPGEKPFGMMILKPFLINRASIMPQCIKSDGRCQQDAQLIKENVAYAVIKKLHRSCRYKPCYSYQKDHRCQGKAQHCLYGILSVFRRMTVVIPPASKPHKGCQRRQHQHKARGGEFLQGHTIGIHGCQCHAFHSGIVIKGAHVSRHLLTAYQSLCHAAVGCLKAYIKDRLLCFQHAGIGLSRCQIHMQRHGEITLCLVRGQLHLFLGQQHRLSILCPKEPHGHRALFFYLGDINLHGL